MFMHSTDINMQSLIVFVLALSAVAAVPANPQRIVGGSTTTITTYPSIVALLFSSNLSQWRQSCGGTIINNRSILTAAHCPHGDNINRWRVRVGSTNANSGGRVITSQRFIIHGSYNRQTLNNDIAIIRLTLTISFSTIARPTSYAGVNYRLGDGQAVWAAGWGRTSLNGASSEQLRHVRIWTVNQANCRMRYSSIGRTVTDNMLCAGWLDVGGRDQCHGDSGGPLYHNRVLVGVCSWGQGCGSPRFPGVNVRVSRYATWIRNNSYGDPVNRWRVRSGSASANSGGRVTNSQRFIIHGSYNSRTYNNDIAIIRLANNIAFGPNAQAAAYAGANINIRDNQAVWAAGWGRVSSGGAFSEQLRHVQIWTVNQATCRNRYSAIGRSVTDNMLCVGWLDVGGRDQCQGDSGGPVYMNRVLVGICSWGEGCGLARFPGVNIRVSRYTNWIRNNT